MIQNFDTIVYHELNKEIVCVKWVCALRNVVVTKGGKMSVSEMVWGKEGGFVRQKLVEVDVGEG
jgi:hypothetical protein